MKKYLLLAGSCYYPRRGIGDWQGCFETIELAEKQIETTVEYDYFTKGPRKGEIKEGSARHYYKIGRDTYDWYEIVDLDDWIG
jgi:hypothetical protein